jgi:tight adherence protein B
VNTREQSFTLAFMAALVLLWANAAHAAVELPSVNTHTYPNVTFSIVTDTPSATPPKVFENGTEITGAQAVNLGSTASVVLAIDRSRSMAGRSIADASAAADTFVAHKPVGDAIAVVAFGSHAIGLTGFSTSTIDADGALRTLSIDRRSGTALYDAITLSASQLQRRTLGGRVLVVLTDGKDVSSKASLEDAIAAAQKAGISVYPIAIAGPEYTPRPLEALARATGGTFYRAARTGGLTQVYAQIATQLARTWQISYLTSARPGDRLDLRVTVPGQGAAARDVQVPAGPGGATAPSGPTRLLPKTFFTSPGGTVVVALVFGALVLLGFLLILGAQKSQWLKKRLQPHIASGDRVAKQRRERFTSFASIVRATERTLGNFKQFRWLSRLLDRADLPVRAAEFAYIIVGSGLALGLVVGVASGSVAGFFAAALFGSLAPLGFAQLKARGRLRAFDNQLADLLVTLAASMKAGHSFRQGIQSVVDEGLDPAAREFKRVLTDTQLGRPMEDSLAEMAERVGSKDFTFVITAVNIQRQVGGSLASLFDMVSEVVRQRQQFGRRIRSLTAMGRASAYVLVALPFFLAFVLTLINRKFMTPLFTTHIGHLLLFFGLLMMMVGSALLKKIVSFRG